VADADARDTVVSTIRGLLKRRRVDVEIDDSSDLYEDLGLDSLELAELSAKLEDDLGSDPYSAGEVPRTVGEVLDYYDP
jgi:acyl carrier protein